MKRALVVAMSAAAVVAGEIQFDGKTFRVPEGFTMERVAGRPLVDRPIEADFDEKGGLYVTDSSGTNDKVEKQLAEKPHRIVRLVDANKDGIYDERTIFADKMMFPEGAMFFQGSLYVSAPPVIWKLTDTNDDGVADKREEWFNGGTLTGCANDLHGPYAGPDGWIYWTKGAFAKQTHQREGRDPIVTRAAHIFRARPDGSGLETVMTGGMDNPVGVAFTKEGERFFTSTFLLNPEAGRRDGLVHAIYGGVYGKDHDVVNEHPRTGELMPITTHLGPAAPAGLHRYKSAGWGAEFEGNMFVAQFNLRKVSRHVLKPEGATFKTEDSDFVSSESTDFHPTDVFEDADGSLLVIDTGGWYKLCCPTSQLAKPDVLGAIYRIRKTGAKTMAPIESKTDAIWALTKKEGEEARRKVREALSDSDASARIAALHSIALWRDKEALDVAIKRLKEGAAHEKRVAAEALGRIGDAKAVPALLLAAASNLDRVMEHSLAFALIEIGDVPATRQGLRALHINTPRVAMLALNQMKEGLRADDVIPYLTRGPVAMRQTAAWVAERKLEWAKHFVAAAEKRFSSSAMTDAERETWTPILARLAQSSETQAFLVKMAGADEPANRKVAFTAMRQARLKAVPEGWTKAIVNLLDYKDTEMLKRGIAAARELPPKTEAAEVNAALARVSEDAGVEPAIRVSALRAKAEGGELSDGAFHLLGDSLLPTASPGVRGDALAALQRAKLTPEQRLALARRANEVGPMELPRLIEVVEKDGREEAGLALVEALKKSKAAESLSADSLKLAKFPETVRRAAAELKKSGDAAAQRAELESRLQRLKGGDIRRGQALFNSAKTACSSCHAIGYVGGKVGPDLTNIGTVRTEVDLLESILFPSASFVRSYESVVATTKDGETHTGILRGDNDDGITLVAGPNAEERIARVEITDLRPGSLSIMPAGLDTQLTEQELADLLAFLKGTKWGAN